MIRLPGVFRLVLLMLLIALPAAAQETTPTPTPTPAVRFYTISPGDDLGSIARLFDISVRDLMSANGITDPNLIYSGLRLRIPLETAESGVTSTPAFSIPTLTTTTLSTVTPTPTPTINATESATTAPTDLPVSPLGFDIGGVVINFDHPDLMHDAGMTWVSIPLHWNDGDSVNSARRSIQIAHERGFSVLVQISGSPQDIRPNPTAYYQRFAAYLGEVASYNPDAIQVWDRMNVPESWARGFIGGSAYTQMLSAAFRAIKITNPDVLVVSGGLAEVSDLGSECSLNGCNDLTYLGDMAVAGVGQYADCIGINYTSGTVAPTAITGDVRGADLLYYYPSVVGLYAGLFPDKPLCFTKLGYLVGSGGDAPEWAADTTRDDQAQWLAQAVDLARQAGRIRLVLIDNVDARSGDGSGYALVRDGECPACDTLADVLPHR